MGRFKLKPMGALPGRMAKLRRTVSAMLPPWWQWTVYLGGMVAGYQPTKRPPPNAYTKGYEITHEWP